MTKTIATFVTITLLAAAVSHYALESLAKPPTVSSAPSASSAPAASRPASMPASSKASETYPPAELAAACAQAAKDLQARLDKTFHVIVEPPFVIAGNMSTADLHAFAAACVVKPAGALWKGYFDKRPDHVITVTLFSDDKSYRLWAKTLFGDTDVSHFGYYRPDIRTLVMNIGTGGGTLIHELTHSLIVYDFPDVPTWFNEGFASLHEQCNVKDDTIIGLENWRLGDLQSTIRKRQLRSLKDMVTEDNFYGPQQGINYAQSRYLCLYMQRQGLLKDFYTYFRANHDGQDAGVKAIEHVFGKNLATIEKDYLAWVMTLKFQ